MDAQRLGRLRLGVATLWVVLLVSRPSRSDANDPREAARELGYQGIELFEAGDFRGALDRLSRARELYAAPTLTLWQARALVRLGRLVEAAESYRAAARATVSDGDDAALSQAKRDAAAELSALEPRIPRLRVIRVGTSRSVALTIDRVPRDPGRAAQPFQLDPGLHVIELSAGRERWTRHVTLAEGERSTLEVELPTSSRSKANPGSPAPPSRDRGASTDEARRTLGIVSVGVGSAGALTGIIAGGFALRKRSELDQVCDGTECPSRVRGEVGTYNATLTVSTVGFVVGAVGLGTGLTLLLWSSDAQSGAKRARVSAALGPGSAGVVVAR